MYSPSTCITLCYAETFYKRCNCSAFLGLNITNTECIESPDMRQCVMLGIRDFQTIVRTSQHCISGCLPRCKQSNLDVNIKKESRQTTPPEKLQRLLSHLVSGYTNGSLAHELHRRVTVAAHLRSLRSDDSPNKGHPRPIKQRLELCRYQTYFRNY